MISTRQALDIRDGNMIHDFSGRYLEVYGYSIVYEKGIPNNIEFSCRDIYTNEKFLYSHNEIYISFDDLSDECKMFLIWFRQEKDHYLKSSEEIQLLKIAFMAGFNNGYSYKQQKLAEAQLQK